MKKKYVAELGHSDRLKHYVNSSKPLRRLKHVNDLVSETTKPMVLKFPMQHDQITGFQNDKI